MNSSVFASTFICSMLSNSAAWNLYPFSNNRRFANSSSILDKTIIANVLLSNVSSISPSSSLPVDDVPLPVTTSFDH